MSSRRAILVPLLALVAALAACGGGSDEPSASGPDPEAFCAKHASDTGQIPENEEQWGDYADAYEELAILAPSDVQPAVETFATGVGKVAEGSQNFDDIYNEPGTSKAYDDIAAWVSDNCDSEGGYFPGG